MLPNVKIQDEGGLDGILCLAPESMAKMGWQLELTLHRSKEARLELNRAP